MQIVDGHVAYLSQVAQCGLLDVLDSQLEADPRVIAGDAVQGGLDLLNVLERRLMPQHITESTIPDEEVRKAIEQRLFQRVHIESSITDMTDQLPTVKNALSLMLEGHRPNDASIIQCLEFFRDITAEPVVMQSWPEMDVAGV